ncbi:MAG: protein translocase SEC61 complex subunit gamma [archaeon]|nr:protein translocase SEC61 complex subunit gamma [archaeon]
MVDEQTQNNTQNQQNAEKKQKFASGKQQQEGEQKQSPLSGIARFFRSGRRIITVSKKPDRVEYTTIAKVTGLGIIIIGVIGFIIILIFSLTGIGKA